jgi:hypothetical protein
MTDQDGWLTGKKEIGKYLGVTGGTVLRWRKRYRDFPVKILEGRLKAKRAALDAWVNKRGNICALCGAVVLNGVVSSGECIKAPRHGPPTRV